MLLLKATLTSVLPQRKKAGYRQVLRFIYYRLPSQTSPSPPKPFILFQKEISAALGRAVPQALSDIFSCTTGISTPTCPRRQSRPQPPFPRPGDGSRVQDWEVLGGTAGASVRQRFHSSPSSIHAHTLLRTSLTPPEAQHCPHVAPRMGLLLRQVLQRKTTGINNKLPAKSILTTV